MTDTLIHKTESAFSYQLLIKNILYSPVVNAPEQEIVYRDETRMTYRQFKERVGKLANALSRMGVNPGDTVAVMDYDSNRYLECYFAVPMMGAVLHHVNIRLTPEQILYTIDHAEDDVILVHEDFLPIIEAIKGRLDTVKRFILIRDKNSANKEHGLDFYGEYEDLLSREEPSFNFSDFDENTRATTFYTTGTTGMPKGVYFSHRQLVLHTFGVIANLATPFKQGRFHREDVYMPMTPMFHVHAWGLPYVATALGIKQVYPGRYAPDTLLEYITKEKVTFTHCVPTILRMILGHPSAATADLSGLTMIVGGSAMSKQLCLEAMAKGMDVLAGYGMSETCPILTISHLKPEMVEESLDSQAEVRSMTGLPLPLVDIRLVDEEMNDKPNDGKSAGEIVVRSPWLTQGYLKDQKNSEKLWHGGWLHTSDMAIQNDEGYIRITDRLKDVIKVAGEWVSSLELEDLISHHPMVAEVAVIGVTDERWGERPLALVVQKPSDENPKSLEKSILGLIKGYADKGFVSRHALILKVKLVDAIDKTSVGKINKVELRKKHGS